MTPQDILSI